MRGRFFRGGLTTGRKFLPSGEGFCFTFGLCVGAASLSPRLPPLILVVGFTKQKIFVLSRRPSFWLSALRACFLPRLVCGSKSCAVFSRISCGVAACAQSNKKKSGAPCLKSRRKELILRKTAGLLPRRTPSL